MKRKFVVTGSRNDIGRVIVDKITSAGFDVARVSRADEDLHQRENEIRAKLAEAFSARLSGEILQLR